VRHRLGAIAAFGGARVRSGEGQPGTGYDRAQRFAQRAHRTAKRRGVAADVDQQRAFTPSRERAQERALAEPGGRDDNRDRPPRGFAELRQGARSNRLRLAHGSCVRRLACS
jgi:hypothetical protein